MLSSLIDVFSTVVCFTMGICDILEVLPNGGDSELVIVSPTSLVIIFICSKNITTAMTD